MTKLELLRAAQKILAIQDVYPCDANIWANRDYDPVVAVPNNGVQFKLNPTNDCQVIEIDPPQNGVRYTVRYIVGTGVRILGGNLDLSDPNVPRDKLIAEIEATFIVKYVVVGDEKPTDEMLEAFNENAVYHAWPYWREFLQAVTVRLRVPPVVLPIREVAGAMQQPPVESTSPA